MAPLVSLPGQVARQLLERDSPTRTVNRPNLVIRQSVATATVTVTSNSGNNHDSGLSGGAIAGIVIGSVIGFLLIIWIIRSCTNLGSPPEEREKWYRDPPRHRHRSRSTRRSSSLSVPPPVVVAGSRSRSRHRRSSPSYYYRETDGGRGRYYSRH